MACLRVFFVGVVTNVVVTAAAFGLATAWVATADPAPTPPAPSPANAMDHDGTYAVGTDIEPGTYASPGPAEGSRCYWKRIGGDDGATILDNALSSKPQLVEIEPTDAAFKTSGCQPWQAANGQTPSADTPPWLAQLQLRHYLDVLNGLAGQSGNGQLPPS